MNEDKASRYHRRRRRAGAAGTMLVGAVLLLASLSGAAAAGRSWAESTTAWLPLRLQPFLSDALFLMMLSASVQALTSPSAWYQTYWLERRYGLSTESLRHWLVDHVKTAAASGVALFAGAWVAYACMQAWPERWWLGAASALTIGLVAVARLAPAMLVPVSAGVGPLGRDALSQRLERLAERAGARVVGVHQWALGGHSRKANAALAGIGGSRRILLSDTLLESYGDDEIEVVVAHELAHHVHHDLWATIGLRALVLYGGSFIVAEVLAAAAPWLTLRSPTDVAGAPVLLLMAGALSHVTTPIGHALSRAQERRADRYALWLTGNPAAFISVVRRLGQQNLAEARPSPLVLWLHHSHPPLHERIAAAEAWRGVVPSLPAHGIITAEE